MKVKLFAYLGSLVLLTGVSLGILLLSFNRVKAASSTNVAGISKNACQISLNTERRW